MKVYILLRSTWLSDRVGGEPHIVSVSLSEEAAIKSAEDYARRGSYVLERRYHSAYRSVWRAFVYRDGDHHGVVNIIEWPVGISAMTLLAEAAE